MYVAGDPQRGIGGDTDEPEGGISRRYGPCCICAEEGTMLFTIAVILLVLWLLGMVSGYTIGNFIYVLLVIALVLFVVGLVSGRRTV